MALVFIAVVIVVRVLVVLAVGVVTERPDYHALARFTGKGRGERKDNPTRCTIIKRFNFITSPRGKKIAIRR